MIKASKKDEAVVATSVETKPAVISPLFVHWYEGEADGTGRETRSRLELASARHESTRRDIRNLVARANEYKRLRQELETILSRIDVSKYTAEAVAMAENLRKLSFVESVKVRGVEIIIRTRLIFTDIRLRDGARTKKRVCIGAFDVRFSFEGTHTLSVRNRLFGVGSSLDHWSIRNGVPCLGEWENTFYTAWNEKNVYDIATLVFAYLKSTDDSGAYQRSHQWRDNRSERLVRTALRLGSYCMVQEDTEHDGMVLHKGALGKVVQRFDDDGDSDLVAIEFKNPLVAGGLTGHDANGHGKHGHCWVVYKSYLRSITKKQWEDNATPETLSTDTLLEKIDALPDGSSLSDAKSILRK